MVRVLILGANGQLARNTTKFFLERTDAREDTSTLAVLTSNPASARTLAAVSAFSRRRSASRTRLPALTRRAMA